MIVVAGLELLKTIGRIYVQHVQANPTYQLVAGTVGLLISLSIINQLVLFAAALTATSTSGDVTDLSARAGSPKYPVGGYRRRRLGPAARRCRRRRRPVSPP